MPVSRLSARTYITAVAPYLLAIGVILYADFPTGVLSGAGFGLGRAAMPVSRFANGDLRAWDRALGAHLRVIELGSSALTGVAGAAIAVSSLRSV